MSIFGEPASTPPLARHPSLRPLSREHMGGLILARRLEQASDPHGRLSAVAAFAQAWHKEVRAHFDDEERLLLPLGLPSHLQERLLEEHGVLRSLAARCACEPARFAIETATVQRLGRLLREHIRWEERVLFQCVQRDYPRAVDALLGCSQRIEQERPASRPRYRLDWSPEGPALTPLGTPCSVPPGRSAGPQG